MKKYKIGRIDKESGKFLSVAFLHSCEFATLEQAQKQANEINKSPLQSFPLQVFETSTGNYLPIK